MIRNRVTVRWIHEEGVCGGAERLAKCLRVSELRAEPARGHTARDSDSDSDTQTDRAEQSERQKIHSDTL